MFAGTEATSVSSGGNEAVQQRADDAFAVGVEWELMSRTPIPVTTALTA